jgi:transcriptional regulator with PAS, ATPase and Fis domain
VQYVNENIYSILNKYDWPGNLRELENMTERIIALSPNQYLNTTVLDPLISGTTKENVSENPFEEYGGFDKYILSKEREIIDWALNKAGNNVSGAAKILKIPRTTLRSKMDKLSMESQPET